MMKNVSPKKVTLVLIASLGSLIGLYLADQTSGDVGRKDTPRRIATRVIPMAATDLKPGMVVTTQDLGAGPWPRNEIVGDVLLGTELMVGRVVKTEIKAATPIHASSLYSLGQYSKEYIGVP